MPHDVTMPQLGMAQDAGKIVSWLKSSGEAVTKGDALFEVETDKAVTAIPSPHTGTITDVRIAAVCDVNSNRLASARERAGGASEEEALRCVVDRLIQEHKDRVG